MCKGYAFGSGAIRCIANSYVPAPNRVGVTVYARDRSWRRAPVTADEGAGLAGAGQRRSWNRQLHAYPFRLCR